ncbi:unnamed protein product [Pseudo-nitzschia multistriata]|uniref:Uncharacterized protein n=1 Tax=Pseudo-nitzschia multistriata TaxID=183589 RepID=A0A448ZB21_9STRA|nr:unnamed protein product [Pseudo-nitzschia multistriata]
MFPTLTSKESQAVQFHSLPFSTAFVALGPVGSLKVMKGTAKFKNPFLYDSMVVALRGDPMILYSSMQINPVTNAVVVAIAGMILPAMARDLCVSSVGIE